MVSRKEFVRMTDVVAIGDNQHLADMKELVRVAKDNDFWLVYGHQCYTDYLVNSLKNSKVKVGGPLNFGLGMDATELKLFAAEHFLVIGCDEIDMVMNLSYLREGQDDKILDELRRIRGVVPCIFKVIIEAPMLNEDELKRACEIVIASGADFIKTGTGFHGATTVEMVKKIAAISNGRIGIKAAGGIRDVETVQAMIDAGVTRFGMSYITALSIAEELERMENE